MVYVIKRLKNKEEFNASKIEVAIKKAFFSCHKEIDKNHFDKIIGLQKLKAIHLNDSMNSLEAHKDRHQKIGQGCIGEQILRAVIQNPRVQNLPFILETPNDDEGYAQEIKLIKSWMI